MSLNVLLWVGLGGISAQADVDSEIQELSSPPESVLPAAIVPVQSIIAPNPFAMPSLLRDYGWFEAARTEYLRIAYERPGSLDGDRALYEVGQLLQLDYGTTLFDAARFYHEVSQPTYYETYHDGFRVPETYPRVRESIRDEFLFLSYHSAYLNLSTSPSFGFPISPEGPFYYRDSESFFSSFELPPDLNEWSAEIDYMAGWVALAQDQTEDAMAFWNRVDDPYLRPRAQQLISATESRDLPERNRVVAGVLAALVPGGGHLYANAPGQGVLALLGTGAMSYFAWDAYSQGKTVQFGLFATSALLTHLSSIKSALDSVESFNVAQGPTWLTELEAAHTLNATLEPGEGDTLELRFELEANGNCEGAGPEWRCSSH